MKKIKILVIDDEVDYTDNICQLLKLHGYDPIGSYSVEKSKKILKDQSREIDIALIDMYLGTDKEAGIKLLKKIRKEYPWIVPIINSSWGDFENAAKCMEEEAFSYLTKGISNEYFLETIKRAENKRKLNFIIDDLPELHNLITTMRENLKHLTSVLERFADEINFFKK